MPASSQLTVANEIARQIGQRAFTMMGTRNKLGDDKSLTFDIRGCKLFSKVKVTLGGDDLYTVEFFKFRKFAISRFEAVAAVDAESLNRVIESKTGLYLSL